MPAGGFIVFLSVLGCFPYFSSSKPSYFLAERRPIKPSSSSGYACQVEEQRLNDLKHVFLDKESNRSIYQHCFVSYENKKLCCADPLNCQESYARGLAQDLKAQSLSLAQGGCLRL